MILLQDLEVDSWFIIVAVDICSGVKLHQVPVAGVILGQENQVKVFISELCAALNLAGALCLVELAAHNRLYSAVPALVIEVDGPEHIAVVGDGYGGHSQALCLGHHVINLHCSV